MRAIIAALPGFNADTAVQVNRYEVIGPNLRKMLLALQLLHADSMPYSVSQVCLAASRERNSTS